MLGAIIFFCITLGALSTAIYFQRRKSKRVVVVQLPPPLAEPETPEVRKEIDKRRALAIVRNLPRRKRRAFHSARRSGATVDQAIRDIRNR